MTQRRTLPIQLGDSIEILLRDRSRGHPARGHPRLKISERGLLERERSDDETTPGTCDINRLALGRRFSGNWLPAHNHRARDSAKMHEFSTIHVDSPQLMALTTLSTTNQLSFRMGTIEDCVPIANYDAPDAAVIDPQLVPQSAVS